MSSTQDDRWTTTPVDGDGPDPLPAWCWAGLSLGLVGVIASPLVHALTHSSAAQTAVLYAGLAAAVVAGWVQRRRGVRLNGPWRFVLLAVALAGGIAVVLFAKQGALVPAELVFVATALAIGVVVTRMRRQLRRRPGAGSRPTAGSTGWS